MSNAHATCPYKSLPDMAYWKRSVAETSIGEVDPVIGSPMKITPTDKVATAGSCFAQHIARRLRSSGFHYYVPETAPSCIHPEVAARYNYGTFSARFGNIYTTRQLRQLLERAFDRFNPKEPFWVEKGNVIDPFRPQIQPRGFLSIEEAIADRESHLTAVKRMVSTMDVFVFTLGLTETWESTDDGAVFPVCPGCGAGTFDPARYRFLNLTYEEVRDDLLHAIRLVRRVNPSCRFVLTVSPVPLIATAGGSHVLTATTYSKSVLRVVAETIARNTDGVVYFPSYEIITGPHSRGRYFDDDLRNVREEGVNHVMSVFFRHFTDAPASAMTPPTQIPHDHVHAPRSLGMDVVCDEEILTKA